MRKAFITLWVIVTFVATSFSAQVLIDLDDGDTVSGATFDIIDTNLTELFGIITGSTAMTTPVLGTPASVTLTNATGLPTAGLVDEAVTSAKLDDDAVTPAKLDDDGNFTLTGIWNLGGGTLEIPNGTDPDVTIAGQMSNDTDGANVTGDVIVRAFDGTNQFPVGQKLVWLTFPFTTAGAVTNWQPWANESGMTFTFTRIFCRSDTDNLRITINEFTSLSNLTNLNEIVDVTVATDGTNVYYDTTLAADGDVTDTEIESGHGLSFDVYAAAEGYVMVEGWYDANVD